MKAARTSHHHHHPPSPPGGCSRSLQHCSVNTVYREDLPCSRQQSALEERPFTVVIGSLRDSLVRIPNPLSLYTINAQCSRTFGIDILGNIQEMDKTIAGFSCTLPPHRSLGLGNVITRFTIGCANCFCALRVIKHCLTSPQCHWTEVWSAFNVIEHQAYSDRNIYCM